MAPITILVGTMTGTAEFAAEDMQQVLHEEVIGPGSAFRYRPGTVHRVTAIEDTTILEVSTPQIEDIVRLEDLYGREGTSAA